MKLDAEHYEWLEDSIPFPVESDEWRFAFVNTQ